MPEVINRPPAEIRLNAEQFSGLLSQFKPRSANATGDRLGMWGKHLEVVNAQYQGNGGGADFNPVISESIITFFTPRDQTEALRFAKVNKMSGADKQTLAARLGIQTTPDEAILRIGERLERSSNWINTANASGPSHVRDAEQVLDIIRTASTAAKVGTEVPTIDQAMRVFDLLQVENNTAFTEAASRGLVDLKDVEVVTLVKQLGWDIDVSSGRQEILADIGKRLSVAQWKNGANPVTLDAHQVYDSFRQIRSRGKSVDINEARGVLEKVYLKNGKEVVKKLQLGTEENKFVDAVGSLIWGNSSMSIEQFSSNLDMRLMGSSGARNNFQELDAIYQSLNTEKTNASASGQLGESLAVAVDKMPIFAPQTMLAALVQGAQINNSSYWETVATQMAIEAPSSGNIVDSLETQLNDAQIRGLNFQEVKDLLRVQGKGKPLTIDQVRDVLENIPSMQPVSIRQALMWNGVGRLPANEIRIIANKMNLAGDNLDAIEHRLSTAKTIVGKKEVPVTTQGLHSVLKNMKNTSPVTAETSFTTITELCAPENAKEVIAWLDFSGNPVPSEQDFLDVLHPLFFKSNPRVHSNDVIDLLNRNYSSPTELNNVLNSLKMVRNNANNRKILEDQVILAEQGNWEAQGGEWGETQGLGGRIRGELVAITSQRIAAEEEFDKVKQLRPGVDFESSKKEVDAITEEANKALQENSDWEKYNKLSARARELRTTEYYSASWRYDSRDSARENEHKLQKVWQAVQDTAGGQLASKAQTQTP